MGSVPVILLLVGGWFWLTGGRYASTDNAYVQQDRVTITADVSGRIVEVAVRENDHGQGRATLLFRIDPDALQDRPRRRRGRPRHGPSPGRAAPRRLRAGARRRRSGAADDLDFKQKAFDRQQDLLKKGVTSQATYDRPRTMSTPPSRTQAQAAQAVESAKAALGGDPSIATDTHPTVLAALARRDQAALDLANTEVRAPADGVVAQADRLKVGQYVTNPASNPTALMSLVETGNSWVEANFKETDLTQDEGRPAGDRHLRRLSVGRR